MKLINYFACAICAISMLAACENDNNEPQPAPQPEEPTPGSYSGTMNVDQNDGTVFTKEEQIISFEVSDSGVMDILMNKVKFAEAMPSLDITIPDVAYTVTEAGYTLNVCSLCKHEEHTNEVAATGHTAGKPVKENETAEGYDEVVYCTVCGGVISQRSNSSTKRAHLPPSSRWSPRQAPPPSSASRARPSRSLPPSF